MKTKRISISIVMLMLSLICGLGFVFMPKEKVQASAAAPTAFTNYMLESGVPVKKENMSDKAGMLTIDGEEVESGSSEEYVLTSNVEMVASANQGFVLKGWYVVFENNTGVPGTNEIEEGVYGGYIAITNENQLINNEYICVEGFSVENKTASLKILQVSDSIKIAPVYDYEYYSVTFKGVNGATSIINSKVKHNDIVDFEIAIADEVNIDAIKMSSLQIKLNECETHTDDDEHLDECLNKYYFKKDATKRTSKVGAKFTMSAYEDVVINLEYENLFKVDLNICLEGTQITSGTEFDQLLTCVSLTKDKIGVDGEGKDVFRVRYFSKINNTSYFVKNGANFEVIAKPEYKSADGYVFYNLDSIECIGYNANNGLLNFNYISSDEIVTINYTHNTFNVEFLGVDYLQDNTIQVNNNIDVPETKTLTRVNSVLALNDALLEENVGYTFVGYVKYGKSNYIVDGASSDLISSISLNVDKPENAIIYLLYTKTQYTINLTGLTSVSLTNANVSPNVTYYPVASAKIAETTKTGTDISFEGFVLDDEIILELTLNSGFNVTGIAGMTKEAGKQVYSLTLNKEFLKDKSTTINLAISAELLKYSLTYRIAKFTETLSTMADIWVDGEDYSLKTETLSADGKYYEIVIDDLTYYQTLTLKSKVNGTGTAGEYFVFRYFTTDFTTTLPDATSDNATQATHSISFTIYSDSVVYVVYSQPKTQMKIEIVSAPINAGISFAVTQRTNTITADNNGFYILTKGNSEVDQVKIVITGLVNNQALFGYRFVNTELYTTIDNETFVKVTGSEQTSLTEYTFIPTSNNVNELYIVRINIQLINYTFNITSSDNSYSETKTITIENPIIEFDKSTGYYVKRVQFKKVDGSYEEYSKMNQSNSSRNDGEIIVDGRNYFSTYYYKISTDVATGQTQSELKTLITNYAQGEVLNVLITFEIYTYDVNLKYVKFNNNALDTSSGTKLVYPNVELSYKLTGSDDLLKARSENMSSEIKFIGIPYGANVMLQVVRGVSVGFEMKGWYDYNSNYSQVGDIVYNANEKLIKFSKNSITSDFKLSYRVDFVEYDISLDYNSDEGSPILDKQKIKMGDTFSIDPKANLNNGYMFYQIKYSKVDYGEYTFVDNAKFAEDYADLYILDGDYAFKNISSTYNDQQKYYTLKESEATESSSIFKEDNFDVSNYLVDDGKIVFKLEYVPIEMTIENITKITEDGENIILDNLNLTKLGLTAQDIATYSISATFAGTSRPIVENESIVTVNDVITITIQINNKAISSLDNTKNYDLSRGLKLSDKSSVINLSKIENFNSLGGGTYEISFVVKENLKPEFARNGKISIGYNFVCKEQNKVSVTTNMAESTSFSGDTQLTIKGVSELKSNPGDKLIAQYNYFLTDIEIALDLKLLKDLFVINSITAYKNEISNQNKITDLDSYFIEPEYATLDGTNRVVIDYVALTMLDTDIIICFNVQPRIYVEGTEITTQKEIWIDRYYNFEVKNGILEGKAQNYVLSETPTKTNIAGYGINPDIMQIEVWQGEAKIVNGAINVGEYDLKLVFKDGLTADQMIEMKNSWLYYLKELPCKLKLRINQQVIQIETITTQFEKDYTASSTDYKLNLKRNGNQLVSGDNNIIITGVVNAKTFDLGVLGFNTDSKAEIVVYNEHNQLISQKYVTQNNFAHILITGLRLSDNNNFKLQFKEFTYLKADGTTEKVSGILVENVVKIIPKVVEIENIEVYDKVYDESSVAKFGLTEGQNKYVLKYTFTDDNVYLLPEELKVYFASSPILSNVNIEGLINGDVGENKNVIIDARTALAGTHKENYVIGNLRTNVFNYKDTKTIYPAKLSTTIKGVGNVTLINKRGLEDYTKANLIPVGATLNVQRIEPNSAEYREIADSINSFLSRRNVFAAGYKMSIIDKNGNETPINNELLLSLPSESELVNVLSLAGDRTKSVDYNTEGGNIVIDLSQIEEDISYFVLIQNRALLKAWQIVLIVVLSVVAAAGIGVAVFFIIRKRRLRNDKYDTI